MNKPSILKSVSISEMLHMRAAGFSNAEIADKIGCSYNTVNRHIGRAPFVKPGRGRKKKDSDTLGLPPVGDQALPEMPRKSFAQRLEESYGKCCKDHSLANSLETAEKFTMLKGDIPPEAVVENVEENSIVRNPADEKPHKIFAVRLEEMGVPEKLTAYCYTGDPKDIPEDAPIADLMRAHCIDPEKQYGSGNVIHKYKTFTSPDGAAEHNRIHELIAVFGEQAVATWLKVSLYDMRIPDCRPMSRQKMLEMLKNMNAGGATT